MQLADAPLVANLPAQDLDRAMPELLAARARNIERAKQDAQPENL